MASSHRHSVVPIDISMIAEVLLEGCPLIFNQTKMSLVLEWHDVSGFRRLCPVHTGHAVTPTSRRDGCWPTGLWSLGRDNKPVMRACKPRGVLIFSDRWYLASGPSLLPTNFYVHIFFQRETAEFKMILLTSSTWSWSLHFCSFLLLYVIGVNIYLYFP